MRVLIDECLDERFRHSFQEFDCETVRHAKLAGLKNGELLSAAEAAGFDVLVTMDQSMPSQQNLGGRTIAILILRAATNRLADLVILAPLATAALRELVPGQVLRIPNH